MGLGGQDDALRPAAGQDAAHAVVATVQEPSGHRDYLNAGLVLVGARMRPHRVGL